MSEENKIPEEIKNLVDELKDLRTEEEIVGKLQKILEALLTKTEFHFTAKDGKTVYAKPLEIEAYYYKKDVFEDECVHVHKLQENRQGKVYIHRFKSESGDSKSLRAANRAGMDLVLSDCDDFALAVLIRDAEIHAENEKSLRTGSHPAKLLRALLDRLGLSYEKLQKEAKNSDFSELKYIEDKNVLLECKEIDKEKSEVVFSPRINIYRGKKDLPLRANLKTI